MPQWPATVTAQLLPQTPNVKLCALATAALVLAACDEARTPRAVFEEEVVPALEARCAAGVCHGVAPGAEAVGEVVNWSLYFLKVDEAGHLADLDQAYEATRAIIDCVDPAFSPLLRVPLHADFGGTPHAGGDTFRSPADPAYQALLEWVADEPAGGHDPPPLDERERLFAERVQPALFSASCANASCHGLTAGVPYRLDPGVEGKTSVRATRHNYEVSLSMLSLDGDPLQSRLLRKSLPLHAGGIVHRGGNAAFFTGPEDPRAQAIVDWVCAERAARLGEPCEVELQGFVFVRGPLAPAHPFELDTFVPGTDLWFSDLEGEARNLTASLHDTPADIRDPAVDALGERVAFSMRTEPEGGHDLYLMHLDDGRVERLTEDAGALPTGGTRTHRDPTFGPLGRLWFVSTQAGHLADPGDRLDGELYSLDLETGTRVRWTWTPHAERKPVFFVHGEENGGEISFSAARELMGAKARAHIFRFPPDLSTEYHQHFGITPVEDLFYDMRELPDGRYITTVGDLKGLWRAGRLGVVDRNMGPELDGRSEWSAPGLPGYAPPLVRLEDGVYRDVAPLPDGRVLVAYAPQTIDHRDPEASFDLRIDVLELKESVRGEGPRIAARTTLVDAEGVHDRDPEPVLRRQTAPTSESLHWDPEAEMGLLVHNGVAMIDAVLGNLPPSGPKAPRDDVVGVRLVEALPTTPRDRPSSLGTQGPQGILAELTLAVDGTFHAELPPGVPFRVQALDERGVAVGVLHDRWFYVAPGQTVKMGIDPSHYDRRCAACHGAADGDPQHAFPVADAITGASRTQSRYHARNPRRPIAPPKLGAETRMRVDFEADVQPILDAACVQCHGGDAPAAALSLEGTATARFSVSYEALLRGDLVDVDTGSAAASALSDRLEPEHAPDLEDEDRRTLYRWMDLGAAWRGGPSR